MRLLISAAVGVLLATALSAAEAPTGKIAYSRQDGERVVIHIMNADGSGDALLPGQTEKLNIFPAWSTDGKRIAYMAGAGFDQRNFKLLISDLEGKAKAVQAEGGVSGLPAWSPDGKHLALISGAQMPNVYVVDSEGNGLRKISPDGSGGIFPFWSPDSKKIGFTQLQRDGGMDSAIVWVPLEGGQTEPLLECKGGIGFVGNNGLARDGKHLIYTRINPETMKAVVVQYDIPSKSENILFESTVVGENEAQSFPIGSWSADGKQFVVSAREEKGSALYRYSADGTGRMKVTPENVSAYCPAWWGVRP